MSVAVLDLGSNSFSLLVVEALPSGAVLHKARESESVLLGARIAETGRIDQVGWRRSMVAIAGLVGRARLCGATRVVAVATGALGQANNGEALLQAAARQFDIEVELLSPSEAAQLCYRGVRSELPIGFGRLAVIDIGGGSIAGAVGESDEPEFDCSIPLGMQRLRAMVDGGAERGAAEIARVALGPMARAIAHFGPERVVLASGTARAVHKLVRRRCSSGAGSWLEISDLRRVSKWALSARPSALRDAGVRAYRIPTIAISASVIDSLMSLIGVSRVWISRCGLRDGVVARELRDSPLGADGAMSVGLLSQA